MLYVHPPPPARPPSSTLHSLLDSGSYFTDVKALCLQDMYANP